MLNLWKQITHNISRMIFFYRINNVWRRITTPPTKKWSLHKLAYASPSVACQFLNLSLIFLLSNAVCVWIHHDKLLLMLSWQGDLQPRQISMPPHNKHKKIMNLLRASLFSCPVRMAGPTRRGRLRRRWPSEGRKHTLMFSCHDFWDRKFCPWFNQLWDLNLISRLWWTTSSFSWNDMLVSCSVRSASWTRIGTAQYGIWFFTGDRTSPHILMEITRAELGPNISTVGALSPKLPLHTSSGSMDWRTIKLIDLHHDLLLLYVVPFAIAFR